MNNENFMNELASIWRDILIIVNIVDFQNKLIVNVKQEGLLFYFIFFELNLVI